MTPVVLSGIVAMAAEPVRSTAMTAPVASSRPFVPMNAVLTFSSSLASRRACLLCARPVDVDPEATAAECPTPRVGRFLPPGLSVQDGAGDGGRLGGRPVET